MSYPKRPPYFAHRYCRLLTKTCAANVIGRDAVLLCMTVSHQEDSARYTKPITYHTGQLLPILGIRKWDQLDAARTVAVNSGWLHYDAPVVGSRQPGIYWVTIPPDLEDPPDTAVEEESADQAFFWRGYQTGFQDAAEGNPDRSIPTYGDCKDGSIPADGDALGLEAGTVRGWKRGTSYPSPKPLPSTATDVAGPRDAEKQNGKGRHTYTGDFERFWKAYPVSKDKRAAQAKFTVIARELVADADRPDIATKKQAVAFLVTRAESYAATVRDTEPRFIKHAATWLFKGSYDDQEEKPYGSRRGAATRVEKYLP